MEQLYKEIRTYTFLYIVLFPFIFGFIMLFQQDYIIHGLSLVAACNMLLLFLSTKYKPDISYQYTDKHEKVQRCWKCTGQKLFIIPLAIVSFASIGILILWEITAGLNYYSILLGFVVSFWVYIAMFGQKFTTRPNPCMHQRD